MTQESWLPTLKTNTPQEGYELAVKLARKAVGMTQPDEEVRKKLRPVYANDADSLTFASQVVAINFQTVAAANNYWNE
ncbi:hexameric tyrosine-coordinated heme protein [uncultured Planococcus sp.]|uniref:hexameric tyrosine-coordinated heme protein n=1 Tax=Planococcus donghaensis TaxID=414778 RepID=UPI002619DC64|nr:hexameric tyrosine-coordinated heme protein [uncultured Planococcus sp.]